MGEKAKAKQRVIEAAKHVTNQQRTFIDLMLASDMKQCQAYLQAFDCDSIKAARSNAVRVMKSKTVKEYREAKIALRCLETQIDANWVLKESVRVYSRCMHPSSSNYDIQ